MDCISVSYSIYDISNNNNNTIVFYFNDNSFICQNYCYPNFDCANIVDGKINMYYYTSFNESFNYSYLVEYEQCHMSENEIDITILLSIIGGVILIVFTVLSLGIVLCPNPQENPQENPKKEIVDTNVENADDDSNMVELDLHV